MGEFAGPIPVTYSQLVDMINDMQGSMRLRDNPPTPFTQSYVDLCQSEATGMMRGIAYVFGSYMSPRYIAAIELIRSITPDDNPGQQAIRMIKHMEGIR